MKTIKYTPIGIIHSPFKSPNEAPVQPKLSGGALGRIELLLDYEDGLSDLGKFSHIILLYHFHLSKDFKLIVKSSHTGSSHKVFSTKSPNHPNPIGISVVQLNSIDGRTLYISISYYRLAG